MVKYNMAATARRMVEEAVAIKPGEHVLLVTDSDRPPSITEAMAHAIAGAGAILSIMHMPPHKMGGIDPPRHVGAAMAASDVVVLQTSFATVHTDTARAAMKKGARILDMWGFNEDMMTEGGAVADYAEVRRLSERLAEMITKAREVRFTTAAGSDFRCSVEGRTCYALVGVATGKGTFAAMPDGEAAISPVEGTAEGVLVDPFCIERKDLGVLREPFGRIELRGGKVVSMSGSAGAERFWRVLEENGETAQNLAEFALGTNPACRPWASIREGKKTWGTCHVAVGDSASIGGKVVSPLHVDIVFAQPTVYVDGRAVVRDGRVVV